MRRALVDFEAAQLHGARPVGRQHPTHGHLDEPFGVLVEHLARRLVAQAAGITAVPVIDFWVSLLPLSSTRSALMTTT